MFGCILENTIENTFFTCCSHFLTFSQLPNKHVMSFIPKNSNKTQKDRYFLGEIAIAIGAISIAIGTISIGEIAIAISLISMIAIDADWRDRDRVKRRSRDRDRRRSARSRSWSTSIGAVPVTGEIAIVVRRCGWFRRSEGLTAQWRLDRAVRVWGARACERGEETIWSENNDWNQFQSFLADFSVKLKTFSVWPNFTAQPNARFSRNWFLKINFSQNKRSLSSTL